jgi:hypothetical protein
VGSAIEESLATNLNGDRSNNDAPSAGAVYVFSRDSAGGWGSVPAYVKASNTERFDNFGLSVALSGDGNTLAVGAIGEASQIGLTQGDNGAKGSGAVYVYSRGVSGEWSDAFYIKASRTVPTSIDVGDRFGWSVALSADGDTLAVGATGEGSNATGINGDQSDNSNAGAGAVYVFNRLGTGGWQSEPTYFKASNGNQSTNNDIAFGISVALSGSGDTLVVGAYRENGAAVGLDGDQADQSVFRSGSVYTFIRDGGNWNQQAYIKASNTDASDFFGFSVALSTDGSTLAVGAAREDSAATGMDGDQTDDAATNAGAVYVY